MRPLSTAILSMLFLLTVALAIAAPTAVTALKAATAPVLDGKLDDAVWQQGEWYNNFTLLGEGLKPATAQTRFKVAFDQQNLYFAVELLEPQMDKLVARETKRDGRVHSDDVIELMVVPNSARLDYYHFCVNALGTLYDAELRQGGNVRTSEWDANWQAKIGKGPQSWTVEVAIPFVELGLTGASKGDWALNVARERQAGTQELSSFTEGRGGFHQPNLYATLKLPGADLTRYMWTMRPPYEASFQMEGKQLSYLGKTHLTNDTGKFRFIRIKPELYYPDGGHTSGKATTQGFDSGQAREISFSVPVRKDGNVALRFVISDRSNPDDILYIKQVPLSLSYTPLAIDITRPGYRDCIYATQKLDKIEFTVTSALSPQSLTGKQLHAALLPAKSEGEPRPIAQATPVAAAPQ
ncbi:MAG: carbohydrate binding family 9 domain-containing protein, partial [Armatimonadia bacterium]